jgi:hypothetical protein
MRSRASMTALPGSLHVSHLSYVHPTSPDGWIECTDPGGKVRKPSHFIHFNATSVDEHNAPVERDAGDSKPARECRARKLSASGLVDLKSVNYRESQ